MKSFRSAIPIIVGLSAGLSVPVVANATSAQVLNAFSGITNTSNPPYNALAVGPNNLVMLEGSQIAWTDRAGGAATKQSIYSFFAPLTPTGGLYAPRAAFDSVNQRFVVAMQYSASGGVSKIYLAVSIDANPSHGWYFGAFDTAPTINGQLTRSDRPALAVDGTNIYLVAAQYNANISGYLGTELWVIGNTAGPGGGIYNGGTPTLVANKLTASNQSIYNVVAGDNGKVYFASTWSTGAQMVIGLHTYDVASSTFTTAPTLSLGAIDQGGTYTAQQQGTPLLLNAGDKRYTGLAYSSGVLWGVSEVKPSGSSTPLVHWVAINVTNASNPSVASQGNVSGATIGTSVTTFNPTIAASAGGDVVINFTASGPNMFPSDYFSYKGANDSSFSTPAPYQLGGSFFPGSGSGAQNWGYYSSAVFDPTNASFWLSNEYAAQGWWQTAVAQVKIIGGQAGSAPTITSITTSGAGIDASGNGLLGANKQVTLTVQFSEPVNVNTSAGVPFLSLANGNTAAYVAGSGSSALTFNYTTQSGENTQDLSVSALALSGATITGQSGVSADVAGATNFNPPGVLQIDTAAPQSPSQISLDPTTDSGALGDGVTNFPQVKLIGSAESGSTVTLYASGNAAGVTTAAATGAYSFNLALADGNHNFASSATDLAGNVSVLSTPRAITVDSSAPLAPVNVVLNPLSDTGVLGDGVTTHVQVKVDGVAEAGSQITLTDANGSAVGAGLADATTGAFSILTTALSRGNHTLSAKAVDVAGNISPASSPLPIVIETERYDHVVVVILENHSFTDIIGSPDAPFINSLTTQGTLFADYWGLTQPSQPNYIALFSGSLQGVADNNDHFFPATPTLAGELQQAGYSFLGYGESPVERKHAPWLSFGESQNLGRDFADFPTDFSMLPSVAFVIPNELHNMHDGTIADADQWLSTHLGAYAAWAKTHNSLLVVTFDEDSGLSGQHVPTIVVGERVGVGRSDQHLNHYSLLHTIESRFGLPGLTSISQSAAEMIFAPLTAPQTISSQVGAPIAGITNTTYPPHNALCVSPSHVIMAEGTQIAWTTLSGGARSTRSVYSFFGPLNPTGGLYDQRCAYDAVNQRFVLIMQHGASNASNIFVAVSKGPDPTVGWYFGSINASLGINGQATASDRPALAVDGANIYISAPQYYRNIAGNLGSSVWVVGNSAGAGGGIYNGGQLTVVASELTPPDQGPYHVAAGPSGKAFIAANWSNGSKILFGLQTYDVAIASFSPINITDFGKIDTGGTYQAQQLGSARELDAGDKRIASLAYRNGVLWGVSEMKPIGSAVPLVHWYKVDVSNSAIPALLAQGDVSGEAIGPNVATFNPSIAVNGNGDAMINFTASSGNIFPSAYYVYKPVAAFNFNNPLLYQQGASHFDSGDGSSVQRWGTNSTITLDPTQPNVFWLSNEYAANGWWQTAVAPVMLNQ